MAMPTRDDPRFARAIETDVLSRSIASLGLGLLAIVLSTCVTGMLFDSNPLNIGGPPFP